MANFTASGRLANHPARRGAAGEGAVEFTVTVLEKGGAELVTPLLL
jgi:hypothetical protein